ncbi:MAG: SDR family NAD(P)-dependent oxidoreductase [Planctomycetota bacterium]|nr:MAG: SDR family NAD(P)-dependent oxidoreductase [Planctomycetota bacterium]
MKTSARPAVLITGASTGIGEATAHFLAARNFRVYAGVRREEDGERLLEKSPSSDLEPVILDVTDPDHIQRTAARLEQELGEDGLWGLFNNAGIAVAGPTEYIAVDQLRQQFEVNVIGLIAVTQSLLPLLRKAGGRIVNMSSISGRIPAAFMGPYSASKHAVEAFSDALTSELAPWGIRVSVLEPGAVQTPIWSKYDHDAESLQASLPSQGQRDYGEAIAQSRQWAAELDARGATPETVAKAVHHALSAKRPRSRYPIGKGVGTAILMKRLLPGRLFGWVLQRIGP